MAEMDAVELELPPATPPVVQVRKLPQESKPRQPKQSGMRDCDTAKKQLRYSEPEVIEIKDNVSDFVRT